MGLDSAPIEIRQLCTSIVTKAPETRDIMKLLPSEGILMLLASQNNRLANGWYSEPNINRDGKLMSFNYRYLPRVAPDDVSMAVPAEDSVCDTGSGRRYLWETLAADQRTYSDVMTLTFSDVREFCEGKNEHVMDLINSNLHAFRSRLARTIWDRILSAGHIGSFANGVAGPKTVPLFWASEPRINPVGESTISRDMSDADLPGIQGMLAIGSGLIQDYFFSKGIQCCNDTGFENGRLPMLNGFIHDSNFNTLNGTTDNFLYVRPGAMQLLTGNQNVGDFELIDELNVKTTWTDPLLPGLVYDWYIKVHPCAGSGDEPFEDTQVRMKWIARWNLWGYPTDFFQAGDKLNGVTDLYEYEATCADGSFCPAS